MRHILEFQIFENKSSVIQFYHGSTKKFKKGFILKPQADGYTSLDSEKIIEDLFEKYKPKDKISRRNCVYLVDDPDLIDMTGGYTDYVYTVEPIGKFEKSDLAWYTDVFSFMQDDYNEDDLKVMIDNYWNGIPYKNKENSLFEYRCNSAKITDIESNI